MKRLLSEKALKIILAGIMLFVLANNLLLAWNDSQTADEAAHLAAGYSYVTTGDYRLNPEHPALFKLLAGASILPLNTKPAEDLRGWDEGNQWQAGASLVYGSQSSYRAILFAGRLPAIIITLLLVFFTYYLTRQVFNSRGVGVLAAGLLAIDPTLNGHGHLVTNDVFIALAAVLLLLACLKYWRNPTKRTLLFLGLALLLALSAKFSGVILLPVALLVIVLRRRNWWAVTKSFGAVFAVLIIGIWAQYGFQVQSVNQAIANEYGDDNRLTDFFARQKDARPILGRLYTVPIPAFTYVQGLGTLLFHNNDGHTAYLYGNLSSKGWRWYFPAAAGVKLPVVILLINVAGLIVLLFRRRLIQKNIRKKLLVIAGMGAIFLVAGIASKINIGIRHIFGAWPFIYILAAFFIANVLRRRDLWHYLTLYLVTLTILVGVFFSIRNPLSYRNEVGRILEAVKDKPVLSDSNIDWSQDLYRLDSYLESRQVKEIGHAIFTNAPFRKILGVEACEISELDPQCVGGGPLPCYTVISDTALYVKREEAESYNYLPGHYTLADRVGGSMTVYRCE